MLQCERAAIHRDQSGPIRFYFSQKFENSFLVQGGSKGCGRIFSETPALFLVPPGWLDGRQNNYEHSTDANLLAALTVTFCINPGHQISENVFFFFFFPCTDISRVISGLWP